MQPKLNGLNHLRALAIILVFFFHYFIISQGKPEWLPGIASFGWTGVDLFFVLSGFLIASQLFTQVQRGQMISFSNFFIKRFFRIVPAFLVTVAIYFCFPFFREKEALPPLWKFLTFTQNLGLNIQDFGTFSHAWSLCVEEHFYLLLPLILIVLQKMKLISKSFIILIVLFVFGIGIRIFGYNHLYLPNITEENNWLYWYKYIYYPTYNRLDGLVAGVSIAGIYVFMPNIWKKITAYGNSWIVLGLLVMTGAYFLCEDQQTFYASVFGFPLIAIGFGLMVLGSVSKIGFLYRWKSSITDFIATLSYAIYLTHKGIIHTTHLMLQDFNISSNLMLLICIITCLTGAYLLHLLVEKPFMKLRHKILAAK